MTLSKVLVPNDRVSALGYHCLNIRFLIKRDFLNLFRGRGRGRCRATQT